jgi:regulator of cell morphogenesis and NO signaling
MNTLTQLNDLNIPELKIKDIVIKDFHSAHIFEKLGIDFCCGGNRLLTDALNEKNISLESFLQEYNTAKRTDSLSEINFEELDLISLIEYIKNKHHNYIRTAVPVLTSRLTKVVNAHGSKYPFLLSVEHSFSLIAEELQMHMMKEEKILFPLIKNLQESMKFNKQPMAGACGTIRNPISRMESEHVAAGDGMNKIRLLTDNYSLPSDACTTFRVTYQELNEFEKDLHEHVHLENNILFPKAIELEESLVERIS